METEDQVYIHLHCLLEKHYSYIVQESDDSAFQMMPTLYRQIMEYEALDSLMIAIARDESLAKFFPALRGREVEGGLAASSIVDLQTIIVWSDGSSEGMTPVTLSSAILGDVFRYLWSWGDRPSLDDAVKRLPDSIGLARNLAEKRTVRVPAVMSIHNIELIDGRSIMIGAAILRKPIRYDKLRLAAISAFQDAKALVLRFETDFSAIHIRATNRHANREEEQQATQRLIETRGYQSMDRQMRHLQDEANRACFAIVLASPQGKIFSPVQGWSSAVNPLSDLNHSQISSARSVNNAPYPSQKIGKMAERRIARYASLIQRHPDVLKTGIRRILLAVTERMYPEDGFVDAIICWENLFSDTPETSLRVCGSMAKLLGSSDAGSRREIYSKLSKLYRERSKLVHGSSSGTPEKMYEYRDSAIQYSLDAFRAIYKRDDLLVIKESPERALMALLGR
jgi:hypothetical protein